MSTGKIFCLQAPMFQTSEQDFIIKPPACLGTGFSIEIYHLLLLLNIISPWAYSGIFRYTQAYSGLLRQIQAFSEPCLTLALFRTLVYSETWHIQNPGIFRNLTYSKLWYIPNRGYSGPEAYPESWHSQNHLRIQNSFKHI